MVIYDDFIELLKKMSRVYEETGINLTLSIYEASGDNSVPKYKYFLSENIMEENKKSTYLVNWLSGAEESWNTYLTGREIYRNLYGTRTVVKIRYMEDKYGEEEYDNNLQDCLNGEIEEAYECDLTDEELEKDAYDLMAMEYVYRTVMHMEEKIPFVLIDNDGGKLFEVKTKVAKKYMSDYDLLKKYKKTRNDTFGRVEWCEV